MLTAVKPHFRHSLCALLLIWSHVRAYGGDSSAKKKIVGARLAGDAVTEVANSFSVLRGTVSNIMTAYTVSGIT